MQRTQTNQITRSPYYAVRSLSTNSSYTLGIVTVLSWLAISIGKAVQEAATSLGSKQKAEAIF